MNLPFLTKWPVSVEIWERRGDGWTTFNDKARRYKTKDGRYYFKLKGMKETTKPVDPRYLIMAPGGKQKLKMFSPMPGIYNPIKVSFEEGVVKFKVMDEDTRRWVVMDSQETYQRYKEKRSWLAEYGGMITMITFGIIFIVVLVILTGYLENITSGLSQLANSIMNMADYINIGPVG